MRLIDADKLLRGHQDHERISTHLVWNAPTVEAIPIEWLKENLENTEFVFGSGVNTIYAGETIWELIVNAWREDNGDEWWREEQDDETD